MGLVHSGNGTTFCGDICHDCIPSDFVRDTSRPVTVDVDNSYGGACVSKQLRDQSPTPVTTPDHQRLLAVKAK